MTSPSPVCRSCLRVLRSTVLRSKATPRPSRESVRAYRTPAASSPPSLYLDFLAPSSIAPYSSSVKVSLPLFRHPGASRTFAAATAAAETSSNSEPPKHVARAILNPRDDPDGNPMLVAITPRAAHRLSTIATTDNNPDLALRVTVESGGCHGFQYLMDLVDLSKKPAAEDDTVFEGDKGSKVVIDEASLELLNGSTVDYTMELIGSQFKITGIPGATSSCGCGTSFDIKI